ncbi:male-enhanced antigen 1 [Emydura macquarii macquarii]|uniref:male-enhanced antigen 1 n=1 Tax=Emydura macquarii macquarii TaxID=1129001 RepID=UPI00352AEDFB
MDPEPVAARKMGPERICPNEHEELGPQEVPEGSPDPPGDWSSEEPEEEEEEGADGYFYQPLNQDPEQGSWDPGSLAAEEALGPAETAPGIQERLQMLRLHLPDPPVDSEEEEEGAAAQSSRSSIPMDPEHVELVKRTMAGVKLPTLGIPAWASEISDDQWTAMVQRTLQVRQNLSTSRPEWK